MLHHFFKMEENMLQRSGLLAAVLMLAIVLPLVAQEQAQTPPAAPAATLSAVEVKQITPYRYAALMMKGSYDQHSSAFQHLYQLAGEQNLGYDFQIFGIYFSDPSQVPVDQLDWQVGFALTEGQQIKEPLVEQKWDYEQIAVLTYDGPFNEEMNKGPQALMTWIMSNGYTPVGPMMEKYLTMPTQNEQGIWTGAVEISEPVKKQ
jgi:AraC family transcriptional regulator